MKNFIPPFQIGDIVTHRQLIDTFKVGNMGGMRRSKTTNSLVIIADHTKELYNDIWCGDELHYTGMGKSGDQILNKQNRTLAESDANGISVHLFEVFEPSKYVYKGIVKLCGEPYQEDQEDIDGNMRKVWIFPLIID